MAGALVLLPAIARGAPGDPAAAEVLFRDGRVRSEAGDFTHACPLFAESLRLDYALGTLLNLASCEEHVGSLSRAWGHYAELVERLPPDDERREVARERAAYLDHVVPRLTIVVSAAAPAETRVTCDEIELRGPSLGVALPLDEGAHTVAVDAPGHATKRWNVRLGLGDRRVVVVVPGEPVVRPVLLAPVPEPSTNGTRRAAWIVGGVGVASLAVGTYFGARALAKRSDSDALCTGDVCRDPAGPQAYDEAKSFSRVADVTLGLGLVAVAAASYLFLSSSSRENANAAAVSVRVGPSGVVGTW